ncbi:hypothetical protein PMKS-002934 [Pichia membranifaciens]|uniref:Uncharacterized protein n=1 Tax=Pichia membranifaciens TaxID=4926 RepID=A0A1Q2YIR8_9ASCO|nr:hypothetical protein PMKS-002934 [Pichia membranifaciens]
MFQDGLFSAAAGEDPYLRVRWAVEVAQPVGRGVEQQQGAVPQRPAWGPRGLLEEPKHGQQQGDRARGVVGRVDAGPSSRVAHRGPHED